MTLSDFRSGCPIASTLDLIGDRWSLVLVRDLVNGKKRFSQFLASPEHIATNVLADRLAQLEKAKLVRRCAYQTRPPRYEYNLTPAGAALLPVLQEIARWGQARLPERWIAPNSFMTLKPEEIG